MKNLAVITFIFMLLALPAGQASAVEVAAPAAALAYRSKDIGAGGHVEQLRSFLASHNSPLAGDAQAFIDEAERNNLDWRLVAAIAGAESTFGKHIPTGSNNAWGWGVFTGTQSGFNFKDWAEGIAVVSEGLRKNYLDRGASTIYDIGWIYAANGNSWGSHVQFFINQIESFVPSTPDLLAVTI